MAEGRVKWFDGKKGYGFIAADGGGEFCVHHTSVEGEGSRSLQEGDRVSFEAEGGAKKHKAVRVKKL